VIRHPALAHREFTAYLSEAALKIVIGLPTNREYCGALTVVNGLGRIALGPVPVAARALDDLAAAHGNPTRSSLLAYGDSPAGRYRLQRILNTGRGTPYPAKSFGACGLILMRATDGDAALAEANGRFHIAIQGGRLGRDGRLKATAGAFRISDAHMKCLVALLDGADQAICDCREDAAQPSMGLVDTGSAEAFSDPLRLPSQSGISGATRRQLIEAGGSALAGAIAVNFCGVFIGLGLPAPAYAQDGAYPAYPSNGQSGTQPPGSYLNPTQQGQPSNPEDAPPGTYLNPTQQGQPSNPEDAPPGTYLNPKQQP
jgi:hypothetical protein